MAYNEFAWYYDDLNAAADYEALFGYIHGELTAHGIDGGLLADLGCGTGDLTLMLTQAGYDVIGVDRSAEMLSVLREKADELGLSGRLLLLRQDILDLDLYGTIRAAVATFDTLNHIGPAEAFEKAIAKAAFFMEKGGVFVFDLNTPYKHEQVLGNNAFPLAGEGVTGSWQNRFDPNAGTVELTLALTDTETGETYRERFTEYSYPLALVQDLLAQYGFALARIADGEDFGPVRPDSERWIFTAVKQYTQEMSDEP